MDIQPSAATQTVTLPSAASLAAASPSGIGIVQIKNLGTLGYAGILPNGTDTIDGQTGTFVPAQGQLGPGGVMTMTTVGTTGYAAS